MVRADEVMHGWTSGVQFKEVVSYKFAKHERIILLEMQARKSWVARASKSLEC